MPHTMRREGLVSLHVQNTAPACGQPQWSQGMGHVFISKVAREFATADEVSGNHHSFHLTVDESNAVRALAG
jgi:hypothetical protein